MVRPGRQHRQQPQAPSPRRAARALLAWAIVLAPLAVWMTRNAVVLGTPLITTNTGINLALGNAPWTDPWQGAANDKNNIEVPGMTELEANTYQTKLAVDWIKADYGLAAERYLIRLSTFFRLQDDLTVTTPLLRAAQQAYSLFYLFLLVSAVAGYFLKWQKYSRQFLFIAGCLIYFAVCYSIFFNRIRFRMPTDYLITIPATFGLLAIYDQITLWIQSARIRE